jgi:hypothetical protein
MMWRSKSVAIVEEEIAESTSSTQLSGANSPIADTELSVAKASILK